MGISMDELTVMLDGIVPMGAKSALELQALLSEVDENGNRELDFAEFLNLMKRLHDDNWNNIKGRSEVIASKAAASQKEEPPSVNRLSSTNQWPKFDVIQD